MIKARDVMTTSLVTVHPTDTVGRAVDLLLRHRISGLPVVDDQMRLVGIVSEHDLLHLLFDTAHENEQVSLFMNPNVETVRESDSVVSVAERFFDKMYRRLPVTRGNRLVGMISRHDLIRLIRDVRSTLQTKLHAIEKAAQATSA